MPSEMRVIGLPGLPEVVPGDDLTALITDAVRRADLSITPGDVFVVTQKIVSKAEGRLVRLDEVTPSPLARRWGAKYGKEPRLIEVVLSEAVRVVRMDRGVLIAETPHGFVCANAGVDASNLAEGMVALLPADPDASARRLCAGLRQAFNAPLAIIISDTFGRPWRDGLVNVALGAAGLRPFIDYRGDTDTQGHRLQATLVAVADELASAAELVMAKTAGVPVAVIKFSGGAGYQAGDGSGRELIRPAEQDLFR